MKLSDEDYNKIKLHILRKLVVHTTWGGKHTSFDNLQKGLPNELRGSCREVANDLIKEGILLSHPTSYGLQVSLNPRRAEEIKNILRL
jgi:hypothetical protein